MRRLTRLTNAYSKKWENLKAALALHFWSYNYTRVQSSNGSGTGKTYLEVVRLAQVAGSEESSLNQISTKNQISDTFVDFWSAKGYD